MADDEVTRNLKGMDELDFVGWNSADWHGVFAHYHTDDVLVDIHGQAHTHGIQEHIDAMRAFVETTCGTPIQITSRRVDLVILQPCRGDRLALQRVDQVRAEAVVLQQLYQPPPPERGLKRHRGARWQAPDHAQDRLRPIGHIAVGQYLPP